MVGTNVSGLNSNAASKNISGVVEIPETIEDNEITVVGAAAFSRCERITHVIIKAKIKIIYGRAFADCTSLSYINIPSTVEEIHKQSIHSYNISGSIAGGSLISKGTLVVVFEPHSSIKFIDSDNFDKKQRIALHFSEPVYPKLGQNIFNDVAYPTITCPTFFKFNGVSSCIKSCTNRRKAVHSSMKYFALS